MVPDYKVDTAKQLLLIESSVLTGEGGFGGPGYATGFDPASGAGFVGEDWQSYDWSKLAENDQKERLKIIFEYV